MPGLMQFKYSKRVSLSFKRRGSRSLGFMRYGCYANVFRFDFHFADFTFFSLLFFQAYVLLLRVKLASG